MLLHIKELKRVQIKNEYHASNKPEEVNKTLLSQQPAEDVTKYV